MNKTLWTGIFISAIALSACKSKITGNEGNLEFSYVADDDIRDFNKPIAVGAQLDVDVAEVGSSRSVEVLTATTDDEAILTVANISGAKMTLEGTGAGNVLVSVTAETGSGKELSDSVNMSAAVPDVLELEHTCASGENGYYLTGSRIIVPFEMERTNGQSVIGYGYYPVEYSPVGSLVQDLAIRAQALLHLDTPSEPEVATISSTIDDTTLTLNIVDAGDIEGAMLNPLYPNQRGAVGEKRLVIILPRIGADAICQANTSITVATESSEICNVRDIDPPNNANPKNDFGWIEVEGVAAGTCLIEATFTDGNGGTGASEIVEVEVVP